MSSKHVSHWGFRSALLISLLLSGCARGPAPRPPALTLPPATMPPAPAADRPLFQSRRIVLDPGHGGVFPGAIGSAGLREADINLDIARLLAGRLREAGASVWLTREADSDFVSRDSTRLRDDLESRVARSNAWKPDVFLSIHHNADGRRDSTRNAVETYYRMWDPGSSQDVASRLNRSLAQAQSISQSEIIPGNFYVIRRSSAGAALLGEASYLSNPSNEAALVTPQRRVQEADAYYRALADYFRGGVPTARAILPAESLLYTPPRSFQVDIEDGPGGRQLDPSSIVATLDDQAIPGVVEERVFPARPDSADTARFMPGLVRANVPLPAALSNGTHTWMLQARNINGNTLPFLPRTFTLNASPSQLAVRTVPPSVRHLGGRGAELFEIVVEASDARGVAVEGARGVLRLSNGWFAMPNGDYTRDSIPMVIRGGAFHAVVRLAAKSAHDIEISARIGGLRAAYVDPGVAPAARWVLIEARTVSGEDVVALPSATVLWNGTVLGRTDDAGFLGVRMEPSLSRLDSLTVAQPGYLRRTYTVESGDGNYQINLGAGYAVGGSWPYMVFDQAVLPQMPDGTLLRGLRIALDPDPPRGPTEQGTGITGPDNNYRLARSLQGFLEAAGANVLVTRGADEAPSVYSRLRSIEQHRAQRVILLSHQSAPAFRFNPGSGAAESWCRKQADVWADVVGGRDPSVGEEARYLLRHTSGSAILAQLGVPDANAAPEQAAERERLEALALYQGLLASLAPAERPQGELKFTFGKNWARSMLRLDGNLLVALDRDGRASLPAVSPGTHRVDAELEGEGRWTNVEVAPGRSRRVSDSDLRPMWERAAPASGLPEAAYHQRYPEELKPVFLPVRESGEPLRQR